MAKHTPGPWVAKYDEYAGYDCMGPGWVITRQDSPNDSVVVVEADYKQAKTDAHLIAAAPELLEAAKNMVQMATDPEWDACANSTSETLEALEAAIAKAEEDR